MNAKIIVKVMNFHSLLRVDAAKKKAEKVRALETQVSNLIDLILNNRNFILDKKSFHVDPNLPPLNLYLGSDFGFCGSLNSQVSLQMMKDCKAEKIIIGKKLKKDVDRELCRMTREAFDNDGQMVEELLSQAVEQMKYSEINLIYNHYYNAGKIVLQKKKIFPIEPSKNRESYKEDFAIEGNINDLLKSLIKTYLNYEVRIAAISSSASENILRQNATTDSLKKIDEQEAEQLMLKRKEKTQTQFRKVIDTYVRKKAFKGEEA